MTAKETLGQIFLSFIDLALITVSLRKVLSMVNETRDPPRNQIVKRRLQLAFLTVPYLRRIESVHLKLDHCGQKIEMGFG